MVLWNWKNEKNSEYSNKQEALSPSSNSKILNS